MFEYMDHSWEGFWEGFGGAALLEDICYWVWAWDFKRHISFPVPFLTAPDVNLRCKLSVVLSSSLKPHPFPWALTGFLTSMDIQHEKKIFKESKHIERVIKVLGGRCGIQMSHLGLSTAEYLIYASWLSVHVCDSLPTSKRELRHALTYGYINRVGVNLKQSPFRRRIIKSFLLVLLTYMAKNSWH